MIKLPKIKHTFMSPNKKAIIILLSNTSIPNHKVALPSSKKKGKENLWKFILLS
jgi:hypothetical protein